MKNKLSEYFCAPFWDCHIFGQKREVFSELALKCINTTEKHSGSISGEKQFLIIFVQFYSVVQKGLFTTNPNFTLDLLFFKLVEKTNFLSISELRSEIVTFLTKKGSFQWISLKMVQINRKHSLAVCCSISGEKKGVFFNICRILRLVQKGLFTKNPNFPLDLPLFKLVEKNKLSKYFWVSFWESHFF